MSIKIGDETPKLPDDFDDAIRRSELPVPAGTPASPPPEELPDDVVDVVTPVGPAVETDLGDPDKRQKEHDPGEGQREYGPGGEIIPEEDRPGLDLMG